MTKLILTRHGHVEGIEPRRFRGREDVPLSNRGIAQAAATARLIEERWRPSAVYTSPMSRCIETGEVIAKIVGADHAALETLNDLDYGVWQWKTHYEVKAALPDLYRRWSETPHLFRFPNGESLQDLIARTGDALRFLLEQHADQSVVFVGHDSVNRAIAIQVLDQPLSTYWRTVFELCGISEIDFIETVPCVLRLNEHSHLDGLAEA